MHTCKLTSYSALNFFTEENSSGNVGVIIGISVGTAAVVLLIGTIIFCILFIRKRRKNRYVM